MGELYTFFLSDGVTDYFTPLDVPITYGGVPLVSTFNVEKA
jgi:hypothetical protein